MMKRLIALIMCMSIVFLMTGCNLLEDRVLVANEHKYSGKVNEIEEDASGEKPWLGTEIAVIDTSKFKSSKKITAAAALLIDVDDANAIWGKSIYKKLNPGEVTMLFTAYAVLQNASLDKKITVSKSALQYPTAGYSVLGLEEGDELTVEQLLYGMLLASDVDCANALAVGVFGSMDECVTAMNRLAKGLGCVDTKLANAGGYYSTVQYTTCYDLYLLMNQLMDDPRFMTILESDGYALSYESADGLHCEYNVQSDVKMLSKKAEPVGLLTMKSGKYGSSSSSGHHLVLLAESADNHRFVGILLAADSANDLLKQMKTILKKFKE